MTKFTFKLLAFAGCLLVLSFVFLGAAIPHGPRAARTPSQAPAPISTSAAHDIKPLRELMHHKIHAEYTMLSFTIWHDRPLTTPKFETIVSSSGRLIQLSQDLNQYVSLFRKQGWSETDIRFFDDKRLQLGQVATELQHSAQQQDAHEVTSFFLHLESTCQTCHKRFRPDLS